LKKVIERMKDLLELLNDEEKSEIIPEFTAWVGLMDQQ
jgi:hypothetical protein